MRSSLCSVERNGGLNECGVCQRLWEVADLIARCRIDLFREQTECARTTEQVLEHALTVVNLVESRERLHQPERARRESALRALKAIRTGCVSVQERPAGGEFPADGADGAA